MAGGLHDRTFRHFSGRLPTGLHAHWGDGEGSRVQTVVIDPGHGGQDGGAVAGDGTEESRINLAISLQLEQLLRFAGVRTELTRREDVMVCDPGLETMRQRKVSDLHNRASFVNDVSNAVLFSIHQNSLPSSPVTHGAQTFWNRQERQALARTLQAGLNPVVNTHRAKEPKQIPDSIYLMNHVDAPAVLVSAAFCPTGRRPRGSSRRTIRKRWRRSSRRGICDGWPERIGNESKNAVLLYGMWK